MNTKLGISGKVPMPPRTPMMKDAEGNEVPSMLVRMRCEECRADHRMLVAITTPVGALPEITKSTFRCNCKRHIPTITKMDKSLMSVNGVPFSQLRGLFPNQESFN